MTENKKNILRQVAVKILIKDIFQAEYVQEEEENKSNYLLTSKNEKIYRVNLIAIVVNKEKIGSITNLLVDDGTSGIIVRSFEETRYVEELDIGDVLVVIGKIRIYNKEKYLAPEIIKKTSPDWLKVRSLELQSNKKDQIIDEKDQIIGDEIDNLVEKVKKIDLKLIKKVEMVIPNEINKIDKINEEVNEDLSLSLLPAEKIIKLIKELDKGDGVLIEEIIEKSDLEETEQLLEIMMKRGDIFQNNPGKIKVL